MLRLVGTEWDDAVTIVAEAISIAKQMELRTNTAQAAMVLEALGRVYDIEVPENPERRDPERELWLRADAEIAAANELFDWISGERP